MTRWCLLLLLGAAAGCGDDAVAPPPVAPGPPEFQFAWGERGDAPGQFYQPTEMALGPDGDIYVLDGQNERVQRFTAEGEFVLEWGNRSPSENYLSRVMSAIIVSGDRVFVSDLIGPHTLVFSDQGEFREVWDYFADHAGLAVDPEGNVLLSGWKVVSRSPVLRTEGPYVWKLTPDGEELGRIYLAAETIATDRHGNVYAVDHRFIAGAPRARVNRYTPDGGFVARWFLPGDAVSYFDDVAVDRLGFVYVADRPSRTVYRFSPGGEIVARWSGLGEFGSAFGIPASILITDSGAIYVSDYSRNRIAKFAYPP